MAQNSKIGRSYQNRPSNIILPKSKSLSAQSVKIWRDALALASLAENALRSPLLDIYDSIMIDAQLGSVIDTRILKIQGSKFKIVDDSGKDNADMMKLFEQPWFDSFLFHAMTAKFKGTQVIELWDLEAETMELDGVNLIPAENLIPELGLIVKEVGDTTGYSYKEGPLSTYYIQIRKNKDLGILKNVAPDVISKRFAEACWDEFCERYGIPPRSVTTDSYSTDRHKELAEMMASMINNHWAVLQGNEKIELLQTNGTSSSEIFNNLIKHRDSKIAKRVLGQDGTTDGSASGTFGSLKVFQDVAEDRHNSDKTEIKYLINKELLWRLEMISPAYSGITKYKFDWDESKEMSPNELIESVTKLTGAGYEVDIKYITEKTGIPITGIKQNTPLPPEPEKETEEKKKPNSRQDINAIISDEIIAFYADKIEALKNTIADIESLDISSYTKLIEKIAKDLHDGKLKPEQLNPDLVMQIYTDLSDGMAKGYGKGFYSYKDDNAKRILELKQNLFRFSGAKTYQEIAKLNFLLQGEDGKPRSFEDFKTEALKINNQYNLNYLKTEFQTAQRAGAMADKWKKFVAQSGVYPNLQYKTAKDSRVRDAHKKMEDIIKPIDDKFWDKWYPPNDHNCRCYVVQTDKPATSGTPEGEPGLGFHNNVGKSNQVFDNEHPYFLFPPGEVPKIRKGFEQMKLTEPVYELIHQGKKAKLEGSIWSDPKDFISNRDAGKIIVDKLNLNVKIRPHVNSNFLVGAKNYEFLVDGKPADLKAIEGYRGVLSGLDSANNQGAKTVVFNLDQIESLDIQLLYRRIKGSITKDRKKEIESLILIYKKKTVSISREDILADNFKETLEKLKATS